MLSERLRLLGSWQTPSCEASVRVTGLAPWCPAQDAAAVASSRGRPGGVQPLEKFPQIPNKRGPARARPPPMGRTLASQDPILDQGQGHTVPALLARKGRGVQAAAAWGNPPILLTLGPAALPAFSLWMRETQQVSALWELVGSIRVWWGPPAVVTALFPACIPGAGNPPASRAPVPTPSQQCASAAKRAWAGLLFGFGFPLLLCGSPPPPAPLAHPWNPSPSRWPPALFLLGCGSSSRDGGASSPVGTSVQGSGRFLGPSLSFSPCSLGRLPSPGARLSGCSLQGLP